MQNIGNFEHIYSGKVRDIYKNENDELLFVASDRISAFDWVLPSIIPDKGKILTQLTIWWLEQLSDIVDNHLLSLDVPKEVVGRAMIVKNLKMFPIEAVVRGFLSGSALTEYQKTQEVCGNKLPSNLKDSSKLPNPIFTPATKAELGEHDENITFEKMQEIVDKNLAQEVKKKSLEIYKKATQIADSKGIILADTKFEFGLDDQNNLVLADEVLTPDSSRYWPKATWQEGTTQNSFDKQFVRNWLTSSESGWNKNAKVQPPKLPQSIVDMTREKYVLIFKLLTGKNYE
jgi:phosphoribosylaminoimidazole-succinocarboxamide synthase